MKLPMKFFSRFRSRARPVDPDATLISGYHSNPLGRPAQVALFIILAGVFLGYGFLHGITTPFQTMPLTAPLAVLVGLVVWALPPGERTPWRAIEPLYLAFFVSLTMWPDYLAMALPNLPWITLKRMFAAPLALVFLICISISRDYRANLLKVVSHDKVIWRALVIFSIMQIASIIISTNPAASLSKTIVFQLNCTLIFFASCFLFNIERFPTKWAWSLMISGYVVCFFGFWEGRLDILPWAGHIPSFLKIEDESVLRVLGGVIRSAKGIHRVQSISTTPLGMSELLGLIAPFALYLAISSKSKVLRVISVLFIPVAFQTILTADSRLGLVAMLCAILFYMLIWGALKWRREAGSLFAPALVLAYPVLFTTTMMATFFVGRIRRRIWGDGSQAASDESRSIQWAMGLPKIATHPFGHGYGRAAQDLGYVQPGGILTIDSYYLSLLMDFGLLGLVVYFTMILRAIWISARTAVMHKVAGELGLLLPMAVSLTNFVIVKSVLSQDANHPVVFMMLGGVVALSYRAMQAAQANPAVPAVDRSHASAAPAR